MTSIFYLTYVIVINYFFCPVSSENTGVYVFMYTTVFNGATVPGMEAGLTPVIIDSGIIFFLMCYQNHDVSILKRTVISCRVRFLTSAGGCCTRSTHQGLTPAMSRGTCFTTAGDWLIPHRWNPATDCPVPVVRACNGVGGFGEGFVKGDWALTWISHLSIFGLPC
jgi:hypothetical protein